MNARVCAAVGLAALASGCGGGGDGAVLPQGRFVSANRSLTPPVHLFAEAVVARIEVVVDRERLDPGRVRLDAKFSPYERIGSVRVTRRDFGRYTRLRYEVRLRCLASNCLSPTPPPGPSQVGLGIVLPVEQQGRAERKIFRFRPARVLYDQPRGKARLLKRVWWPPLQSLSRVNWGESQQTGIGFPFRGTVTPLPEATYRVSPTLIGAGLLAGALALLAFPTGLVARSLRRRRPPPPVEEPELSPLERALLLVEWARGRVDGEDRRKALEVLAAELDVCAKGKLADAARELAWSPASPSPDAAGELVKSVRDSSD